MAVYTVSQVASHLKDVLESDPLLVDLLVEGEVSNLRISSAGHAYFTMKDDQSVLNSVMFRGQSGAELLANGAAGGEEIRAGSKAADAFQQALTYVCTALAKELVRDGEGAQRLIEVVVEGDLDLRGTLGVSQEVPVGFETIRTRFEVDAPEATEQQLKTLREKTEQYCVVMQTLTDPPTIQTEWVHAL